MSEIILTNSKISRQGGQNGGCINASSHSEANITDTIFDTVEVTDSGAAVFALDSKINMWNTTVTNTKANSGAALSLSYGSQLQVNNCTFSSLDAQIYGGI